MSLNLGLNLSLGSLGSAHGGVGESAPNVYTTGLVISIDPQKHQNFYYSDDVIGDDGTTFIRCTDDDGTIEQARVNKIVCPETGKILITPSLANALNLTKDAHGKFYLTHVGTTPWYYTIDGQGVGAGTTPIGTQSDLYVLTEISPATANVIMSKHSTEPILLSKSPFAGNRFQKENGSYGFVPTPTLKKVRSIYQKEAVIFGHENGVSKEMVGTVVSVSIPTVFGFPGANYYPAYIYGLQIYTIVGLTTELGQIINQQAMVYYGIS
jgi:hypothetical protein